MKYAIPRSANTGWGLLGANLEREFRQRPSLPNTVVLQAAEGATFQPYVPFLRGKHQYCIAFFEDAAAARANIAAAEQWDAVFVGSAWNAEVMSGAGYGRAVVAHQGIDHEAFRPIPEHREDGGKFVVFSGGKFELRKGQDAVIAAMRVFMKMHEDVVLSAAWDNAWPEIMDNMQHSPYIRYVKRGDSISTIAATLEANNINMDRVRLHPLMANRYMADLCREADVGVFVGRAESGNQPAVECMACGVPLIAMRQTAMRDILPEGGYISVAIDGDRDQREGWFEPSVEDLIGQLEFAYQNRGDIASIAEVGRRHSLQFTWGAMAETIYERMKQ